ncbi:MAG: PKD domain-containing protein [Chloroflexi bacterium]|nr:PKD domain-containing protein [Chloroflexota bacterium]
MYSYFTGKAVRWGSTIAVAILMLLASVAGVSCGSTPAPIAAFTAEVTAGDLITNNPIAGLAPLTIAFTDRSTGEIKTWRWGFGDGSPTVYEQNPSHRYTREGRFTVQLTVEGPDKADSAVKTFFVNILTISEAANNELNQARQAVTECLTKAGVAKLDAAVLAWDGSSGKVTAGGGTKDAADYLARKPFKATYDVALNGSIYSGAPGTWGSGIVWDTSTEPDRWRAVGDT